MRERGLTPRSRSRAADAAAGLTVGGFGVLLLLDALEVMALSFGRLGPAVLATLGVILLARGLSE